MPVTVSNCQKNLYFDTFFHIVNQLLLTINCLRCLQSSCWKFESDNKITNLKQKFDETKFNLKDEMEVLIMINENLMFYTILELVVFGKLNRIYFFTVQFNKKANKWKTQNALIFFSALYI